MFSCRNYFDESASNALVLTTPTVALMIAESGGTKTSFAEEEQGVRWSPPGA
jgi:hypothetical protein